MSISFDNSSVIGRLDSISESVQTELRNTMHDCVDDLVRISTNIAPVKKTGLRASGHGEVTGSIANGSLKGTVTFRAVEKGFNYAIWTHEATYKLGPASSASSGIDGYHVGNKYLSRPLNGERAKYLNWLAEAVRGGIT